MHFDFSKRRSVVLWQLLFLVFGASWLWASQLNEMLSYRTALISQYESLGQPYAWLFRLGDILAALLLIIVARALIKTHEHKVASYMLFVIGFGMLIDPLAPTSCHMVDGVCKEYFSAGFLIHATETVVTCTTLFAIGIYDSLTRKRLVSIAFVAFQVLYFGLFLSQLASQDQFNTVSQYLYQTVMLVWLAWFCRDLLLGGHRIKPVAAQTIKYAAAAWAFLNGLLAIVVSLAHIHLLGRVHGLYFAGDSAWLAQHGVIVGVVMLYLSRHLARGELRARQLFLFIVGIEALKYSVITPNLGLMLIYAATFYALFVLKDSFDRGVVALTLKFRVRDVLYMLGSLVVAGLLAWGLLYRTRHLQFITRESIDHFFDYTLRSQALTHVQTKSALLAHTITAFVLMGIGTMLWILFRPYRRLEHEIQDYGRVKELLHLWSRSSEDYFKLWPRDKQYFWAQSDNGFIAYRAVGPIAFALADPITKQPHRRQLVDEFVAWCRGQRLRACFLPIYPSSLELYEQAELNTLQIGGSALISTAEFTQKTSRDKWWRWQKNRAERSGYNYAASTPPHSDELLRQWKVVSDQWLAIDGHKERAFALGYYDQEYIRQCVIHYLTDEHGVIVAFTNQLPEFRMQQAATVDLLRYRPDASNAMPFLLSKTIETTHNKGRSYFDLGFVPFASTKGSIVAIARALGAGRFSAKGLEQFKNKFNPEWQKVYMAYDGDLADLALIAANLEQATSTKD